MPNQEEIKKLERKLKEEVEQQQALIDALDFIPTVRFINLLRFIAKVLGLSDDAMVAFLHLIMCRTGGLNRLTNEELKQITELLKGWAEAELEASQLDPNFDPDTRQQLNDWLDSVNDALQNWDPNLPPDQAAVVLAALKAALVTQFPKARALLRELIPEELLRQLGENQIARMTPAMLRKLFERILKRWLIRKFGEEVGKSLSGWIKVALDLIELGLVASLLYQISDLADLIDEKIAQLVRKLADSGMGWPNDYRYLWFRDQPPYRGARVIMIPYVRCAKRVNGDLVWSDPCQVKFGDGTQIKVFNLSRLSEFYDPEANVWRLYYDIDADSVNDSDCLENCEICYTYLFVVILPPGGIPQILHILIGVKIC